MEVALGWHPENTSYSADGRSEVSGEGRRHRRGAGGARRCGRARGGGARAVVLEARDRVGGRVHSVTLANGAVVEMGAEFILPGCTEVLAAADRFGLGLWDKGMRYGRREPRRGRDPAGGDGGGRGDDRRRARRGPRARSASRSRRCWSGSTSPPAPTPRSRPGRRSPRPRSRRPCPAAELGLLARVSDDPAPTHRRRQRAAGARDTRRRCPPAPCASAKRSASIAAEEDGVRVATAAGELAADACVAAVPQPLVTELGLGAALGPERFAGARQRRLRRGGEAVRAAARRRHRRARRCPCRTATGPGRRRAEGDGRSRCSAPSPAPAPRSPTSARQGPERWLGMLAELRADLPLDPDGAVLSTLGRRSLGARRLLGVDSAPGAARAAERAVGPGDRLVLAGEYLGGDMSALMEGAMRSGTAAVSSLLGALETPHPEPETAFLSGSVVFGGCLRGCETPLRALFSNWLTDQSIGTAASHASR